MTRQLSLDDIRARYDRALAVKDKGTSEDLLVALIDCVADIPGLLTEVAILRAGTDLIRRAGVRSGSAEVI